MFTAFFILFGLLPIVQGTGAVSQPTLTVQPVHTQVLTVQPVQTQSGLKVVTFTDNRVLTVK
jgi:hypothetical protein